MLLPLTFTPGCPRDQKRRRQKYRRVGAGDDADEERKREVARGGRTDEIQDDERYQDRERRIDGADKRLRERSPRSFFKYLSPSPLLVEPEIFARTIEDDNSVVDGEAEDRENRCHEERIYLRPMNMTKKREESERDNDIVHERNESDESVHPRRNRLRHLAKCKRDEKQDAEEDEEECDKRFIFELGSDCRTDLRQLIYVSGPALVGENRGQVPPLLFV